MILYFTDRYMNILGQASTELPEGLTVSDDLKSEDVDTGVASFECTVPFDKKTRSNVKECMTVGNYILRSNGDEKEFYTIIEAENDTKSQERYAYAEDAGLDLLNEVVGAYEADKAYNIAHYINKYIKGTGFVIGVNEVKNLTRKLSWDGESTVTERLASIATQFDGCEISYSFDIDGLKVVKMYVNIYKERGHDIGAQLRLNQDVDRIVTKESIANLATALQCTGGTPENAENPITLKGYSYDDGDFYVDGDVLKSRKALKTWGRNVWSKDKTGEGHITKQYSFDTTSQKELCSHAITELKKLCQIEVNYEVDFSKLPENIKVGDRVNIIDDADELYLSTRLLKIETSVVNQTQTATLGDFLIKDSGISQKVVELAAKFAKTAQSAARALMISNNALTAANAAQEQANSALTDAENAQKAANEAAAAASTAQASAANAQTAANNAQSAVDNVEKNVESLETTVNNAQAAADNAQQAAETAQSKADEAAQSAANAIADAAAANAAVKVAQSAAETATTKAEAAQSTADTAKSEAETAKATADAAKQDAAKAQEEIDSLGENLETVSQTMSAEYARKTDLTEAEASLNSKIEQNAAQISSTVSKVQTIDETANNAKELAEAAQSTAAEAQAQADQATADAVKAQNAANDAATAAANAQSEADKAKAAAATAQSVADKADADLTAAKEDLATVSGRVDATEEEIAAAQAKVDEAQDAADKAKADAATAQSKANSAQTTADTAISNAAAAQEAADDAASKASVAQATADAAKGDAAKAQTTANEAKTAAINAQSTADTAKTNAANAQAKADAAASAASEAQKAADDADAKAAQAASDLAAAEQNLANVTSRVDATEEEVEAAQAAVATAQAAANTAKANAAAAQSTADTAKANAATAQTAANNAKAAADAAQEAADEAQNAADAAQAAADALAVRVTAAETKITQNSTDINLRATKTEVESAINAIEIGGRNQFILKNSSEGYLVSGYIELSEMNVVRREKTSEYIPVTEGEQYVFQIWTTVASTDDDPFTWIAYQFYNSEKGLLYDRPAKRASYILPNGKWYDFYSITVPASAAFIRVSARFYNDGQAKLEKGNKPTDWTPAPEDIDSRITEAEASINVNAEAIALKASKTEVTNAVNSAKTEMNAAIETKANAITSSVAATYTTKNDFNNLSIGGRNYLKSPYNSNVTPNVKNGTTWSYNKDTGEYTITTVTSGSGSDWGQVFFTNIITDIAQFRNGETNTLSIDDFETTDASLETRVYLAFTSTVNGTDTVGSSIMLRPNSGKMYATFVLDGDVSKINGAYLLIRDDQNCNAAAGTVIKLKVKLEKGNKPTDWTPAPEDLATAEALNSANSQIQQLSNRISAEVTERTSLTARVSTVEQTASSLTVTLNETKNELSNLSIGARNLYIIKNSVAGYLGSDGAIAYPGESTKERTSDFIPINGQCVFQLWVTTPNITTHYVWYSYIFYDANKTMIGSRVGFHENNMYNGTFHIAKKLTPPSGAKYIRVSARMYDDGKIKVESGNMPTDYSPAPEDLAATATNYLNFSNGGLVVGNLTASTLGRNVLIDSDSVDIRNGTTVLASYGDTFAYIGKNSKSAIIDLCNGTARMYNEASNNPNLTHNKLVIAADDAIYQSAQWEIHQEAFYDNNSYAAMKIKTGTPWSDTSATVSPEVNLLTKKYSTGKTTELYMSDDYIRLAVEWYDPDSIVISGGSAGTGTLPEISTEEYIINGLCDLRLDATAGRAYLYASDRIYMESPVYCQDLLCLPNGVGLCGKDTGNTNRHIIGMSENNNVIVGYGVWNSGIGNTHIYGNKIYHYVKTAGTNYKPYFEAGDSISGTIRTAGYVTSSKTEIQFTIPFAKPIIGNPTITITSVSGLIIRQNGLYTHGSSASTHALPSTYQAEGNNYVRVVATMPDTTNAVNNAPCGIYASIKITFS